MLGNTYCGYWVYIRHTVRQATRWQGLVEMPYPFPLKCYSVVVVPCLLDLKVDFPAMKEYHLEGARRNSLYLLKILVPEYVRTHLHEFRLHFWIGCCQCLRIRQIKHVQFQIHGDWCFLPKIIVSGRRCQCQFLWKRIVHKNRGILGKHKRHCFRTYRVQNISVHRGPKYPHNQSNNC